MSKDLELAILSDPSRMKWRQKCSEICNARSANDPCSALWYSLPETQHIFFNHYLCLWVFWPILNASNHDQIYFWLFFRYDFGKHHKKFVVWLQGIFYLCAFLPFILKSSHQRNPVGLEWAVPPHPPFYISINLLASCLPVTADTSNREVKPIEYQSVFIPL